ncbi:MAG: hypothetical protein KAR20_18080 [Candidatus Heimdallarchaeota archaeon]|nr:hypothetical protein [Candidatus Heimdallarchaeota archaeon]
METIYVLNPGNVISKDGSEEHFVTSENLIQLYGLDSKRHTYMVSEAFYYYNWSGSRPKKVIHLYPLASGNYKKI